MQALVGARRHLAVVGGLVDDDALDAVGREHLVPHQRVPEAPCVARAVAVALHGVGHHRQVRPHCHLAGVVAAELEHRGIGVLHLARQLAVVVVPAVVPLVAPAVASHVVVVPVAVKLQVGQQELQLYLPSGIEVKVGFPHTRRAHRGCYGHDDAHRRRQCRAQGLRVIAVVCSSCHGSGLISYDFRLTPRFCMRRNSRS